MAWPLSPPEAWEKTRPDGGSSSRSACMVTICFGFVPVVVLGTRKGCRQPLLRVRMNIRRNILLSSLHTSEPTNSSALSNCVLYHRELFSRHGSGRLANRSLVPGHTESGHRFKKIVFSFNIFLNSKINVDELLAPRGAKCCLRPLALGWNWAYCTKTINSSVTGHRPPQFDEKSQMSRQKSPKTSKNSPKRAYFLTNCHQNVLI